jgi:O-antigen ligase
MVISKRHFDLILLVFVIFSFLTAVIGIWQYVHSASEIGFRAVGTRNLPLTYAESLLFAIALAIPFCNDKKALQKMGRIAILLIFVGGLVVTKSRGPWVAFLLMLAVYEGVRKRFFPWRTLVLSIFLVVSAKVLNGSFSIRLLSITDIHNDLSIADRLYMWKMGGHMFLDRPFWGYGIGTIGKNFMKLEQKYGSIRLYQDSPIPMVWGELHNTYLNLAVERGFPSLICLLAFVSLIVKNLWRYIEDPTTMGIFLGLIGFLVAGLTECVYNDSEIAMLFYMFLGLSVARTRMLDSSESRTDKF